MYSCCSKRPLRRSTKGLSIIALIITIIVIIIIAVIILSSGSSDTITKAQEATFRSDISTMKEQLGIYKSTKLMLQRDFNDKTMFGKVSSYLSRIDKYDEEIEVFGGERVIK
jgi:Tfp pilus assembly protein PilE